MGARSEFKIRNLKFQMDGDGKGEKRTKARGKFAASGGRCASSGVPVLSRWANLCRAYGAEFIVAFLFAVSPSGRRYIGTVLLLKRKERDCDGRRALGMEPCCYGGAG